MPTLLRRAAGELAAAWRIAPSIRSIASEPDGAAGLTASLSRTRQDDPAAADSI
jgi:hypothetical protein